MLAALSRRCHADPYVNGSVGAVFCLDEQIYFISEVEVLRPDVGFSSEGGEAMI